jgi:hypothetical protein
MLYLPPFVDALPGYLVSLTTKTIWQAYLWISPSEMPHVPLYFETTGPISSFCHIPADSFGEGVVFEETDCL